MSNDNTLIIGAAVLGYLYLRRQQAANAAAGIVTLKNGAVASMPGSVGGGLPQIATGAVAGFFQQLAKSPANNSAGTVARMPAAWDPIDRSGIVQEAVPWDGGNYGLSSDYGDYLSYV
jgi:hypothetical protein